MKRYIRLFFVSVLFLMSLINVFQDTTPIATATGGGGGGGGGHKFVKCIILLQAIVALFDEGLKVSSVLHKDASILNEYSRD
jgi:hypothetical protein